MGDILKEGHMKKEGAGVSFGWKKRLFVLTNSSIAYYDKSVEKGRVDLVDILEMAPSNKKVRGGVGVVVYVRLGIQPKLSRKAKKENNNNPFCVQILSPLTNLPCLLRSPAHAL